MRRRPRGAYAPLGLRSLEGLGRSGKRETPQQGRQPSQWRRFPGAWGGARPQEMPLRQGAGERGAAGGEGDTPQDRAEVSGFRLQHREERTRSRRYREASGSHLRRKCKPVVSGPLAIGNLK
jgi:hypothetical protein